MQNCGKPLLPTALKAEFGNMNHIITEYPQFFTATNLNWERILLRNKYKDIIIDSLRFLVRSKRIFVYAFVIMDNHIHLIWQMRAGISPKNVQRDFLRHTAKLIILDLQKNYPEDLTRFLVKATDRRYQVWERNPLSIELRSEKVLWQKLCYIHSNPVRAGLCKYQEQYKYSSAQFYETGEDNWGFLTHFRGW